MQIIEFLSPHSAQMVIAWILGIATSLVFLRGFPRPTEPAAALPPKAAPVVAKTYSASELKEMRRTAAEYAVWLYAQLRPVFAGIPREFWETASDGDFPGLMLDELLRADRIPYRGLVSVVDAFTLENYESAPHVIGAICVNDAAIADLQRFAERVREFKAGQQK